MKSSADSGAISVFPVSWIPIIGAWDNLWEIIDERIWNQNKLQDWDVVVLASKIVSKSQEGRIVNLWTVQPGKEAIALSERTWWARSPKFCELILREWVTIKSVSWKIIETIRDNGMVETSAGIDASNIEWGWKSDNENVILPPNHPDISARTIRQYFMQKYGVKVAVIISDSFGHPYMHWSTTQVYGLSGIEPIDKTFWKDVHGLEGSSMVNIAGSIATAAGIVMGQVGEGVPVAIVRWAKYSESESATSDELFFGLDHWTKK